MKPCEGPCKETKPLSDFGTYPSGTPKNKCKACHALYQKAWRNKTDDEIKNRADYMPECAQVRHPNRMVMEGHVQKAMKKVADEKAIIEESHLPFEAEAGLCDILIGKER